MGLAVDGSVREINRLLYEETKFYIKGELL